VPSPPAEHPLHRGALIGDRAVGRKHRDEVRGVVHQRAELGSLLSAGPPQQQPQGEGGEHAEQPKGDFDPDQPAEGCLGLLGDLLDGVIGDARQLRAQHPQPGHVGGVAPRVGAAVFQEAVKNDAVLFFDEADAVFHRRGMTLAPWTNRDVNVLLNHLENFSGVSILATNLARVMDRALDRRIDIAVEFEIPDVEMRREIWRKLVPKEAPLAKDVDFEALSKKYVLSGGSILNVVRQAMRTALKRGKRHRITHDDFVKAAERELKKSDLMSRDHMTQWKIEPRQRLGGYA